MTLSRAVMRSLNNGLPRQFCRPHLARSLSVNAGSGPNGDHKQSSNSSEPADEFERRIFGGLSGSDSKTDTFFQKFDRIDRSRSGSRLNGEDTSRMLDGLTDSFSTLSDGMDGKLKKEAMYFPFDWDEVEQEDYAFRPDMKFLPGMKYETKDLNLKKPGVRKFPKRREFEVTTKEVLRKADFRNVRFLANFITAAGIIIKRSSTRISAKAQRKVAREIKTARAFGLMPFTTMGTKSFVFGKTMENLDEDYEYEAFEGTGNDVE
ncbi:hypothetical protein BT93_B1621 [Corymbia citriodora subsp. variegata]|nr:hypothetical protein BT93_B1621 [Corymbia citriodora subsp. variegata]KAF8039127.1 hypothetical protein BT93_B1621 [Corymbia citriodora subsp. variegata]